MLANLAVTVFSWMFCRAQQQSHRYFNVGAGNYPMSTLKDAKMVSMLERAEAGWLMRKGVKGSQEMESRLENHGFQYARDERNDEYYVGPAGHIIHLYNDATWNSDKADVGVSLGRYLAWIRQRAAKTIHA